MTTPPSPHSLPIIDLSPFLDPQSSPQARQTTAAAINSACTDYGFFYLTNHGIPPSRLTHILKLARDFFALPSSEKDKIKRYPAGGPEGGDGARGYQGIGENVTAGRRDVHEAIDFYREWDHAERGEGSGGVGTVKTLQGRNLWPERPEELKTCYEEYIGEVLKVGEALVRAMGVGLGLPDPKTGAHVNDATEDSEIFVRNTNGSFWVMRMIGYPPLPPASQEQEQSCGPHTDYGCVTLLLADPTPGALQVLSKSGDWINADPIPGAFVVNIGDMIERWTNGKWKSTLHKVVHRGEGYRVSVPFFFEPNFGAVVRALRACGGSGVGGGTYGEHLLGKVEGNFY